jgi:hypothetical protein
MLETGRMLTFYDISAFMTSSRPEFTCGAPKKPRDQA